MNANLFAALRERMPADLDRILVETPGGRRYRYADALAVTAQLANRLVALGVKPGDRVAVQVDKSPETLLLYLACLRAGAVYLPLNTAYTGAEIAYFLGDAEPALFVCRPADLEQARPLADEAGARVETVGAEFDGSLLRNLESESTEYETVSRDPDDLAAILYTSGTTGRSKGAMLTHRNLLSNAEALAEAWRFGPEDRLLHALPIFHTHGLFVACNVVMMAGASLLFLPKFDVDRIIELLPECTVMMGVPTFYTRLLKDDRFTRELVGHMRLFTSGSAPLTADTHRAFKDRTGHAILERYGMTETNMNTSNPYDGDRVAGTVGFPLPGVEMRVAERDSGGELPQGEIGSLEVRGANVFKGYWRMPEKTRAEFRDDGFFITGDLGFIDERGYVHIVGRDKDLVISGGYNVYPKEIEQVIDEMPEVLESAVIGVPHPDFGEGVTAVVVPREGQTVDPDRVLGALKGRLARYKQPKRVFTVDKLPRNVMGKVQKNELRKRFADIYSDPAARQR
jgi:malonyl-CoA/methylmalonyl-CoA synthetase